MKPTGVVYMCINVCALQLEYAVHVHILRNTCTQSMVQLYMYLYTSIQIHVLRAWCVYVHVHCTYKYMHSELYTYMYIQIHVLRAWCNCIRTCTYNYTCTQSMVQLYTYMYIPIYMYSEHGATVYVHKYMYSEHTVQLYTYIHVNTSWCNCIRT